MTKGILGFANQEQAKHFKKWIDNFTASCSKVIINFPEPEKDNDNDDDRPLFNNFS